MATLIQPTLSILLDRLFVEADAAEDARRNGMESLSRSKELPIVQTIVSSTHV